MNRGDHVRSKTHDGVAFWYLGRCQDQHFGCVLLRMVGDDATWHVHQDDVEALSEDDFCGGCGQIGCGHG